MIKITISPFLFSFIPGQRYQDPGLWLLPHGSADCGSRRQDWPRHPAAPVEMILAPAGVLLHSRGDQTYQVKSAISSGRSSKSDRNGTKTNWSQADELALLPFVVVTTFYPFSKFEIFHTFTTFWITQLSARVFITHIVSLKFRLSLTLIHVNAKESEKAKSHILYQTFTILLLLYSLYTKYITEKLLGQ